MKGSYCLVMRLDKDTQIQIGRKGAATFPRGFYCYVGSAMSGLEARLSRHRKRVKPLHWHIDWFLEHARIVDVKSIESNKRLECVMSQDVEALSDGIPMKGFGSSDCRFCRAHLYHFRKDPSKGLERLVRKWKTS